MPFAEVLFQTAPPEPSTIASTPDPKEDPELLEPLTGQLLLGTDKRNPVFAIYEDQSGQRLLVFYGFEILEIVNNDPEDPAYKLLLGRLYNSGVKLAALCESFAVDPKTIRRWGRALRQGDPAELIRVLEGRSARRKRTVEVERFARLRWPELVAERSYGAGGRLRRDIQSVFGVEISRSGMQSLIRELKAGTAPAETAAPESSSLAPESPEFDGALGSEESASGPPGPEMEKREMRVSCPSEGSTNPVSSGAENRGLNDPALAPPSSHTAHSTPFFPQDPAPAHYWCDHAGVLIFATALAAVAKVSATSQAKKVSVNGIDIY